jgi:hypothetical protein
LPISRHHDRRNRPPNRPLTMRPGGRRMRRRRSRVMRRRRRRIVRAGRRPCNVSRTLIVRLRRSRTITNARVLARRLVRPLHSARWIGPPERARGTLPLPRRDGTTRQYGTRPRRRALGCDKPLRSNVDSTHRCKRLPIEVQRLFMVWPGHRSIPPLRAYGNWSPVNYHQALRGQRIGACTKDWP